MLATILIMLVAGLVPGAIIVAVYERAARRALRDLYSRRTRPT